MRYRLTPMALRSSSELALGAAVLVVGLGACSGRSAPDTLTRDAATATETSTTLAPTTTTAETTTTAVSTTEYSLLVDDATTTTQVEETTTIPLDPGIAALTSLGDELTALLGPTDNVVASLNRFAVFPNGVATPPAASVTEVSVALGTPTPTGVVVQVSAAMTTSATSAEATQILASSLTGAGFAQLDSTEADGQGSTAFQIPEGNRFDEVVITVSELQDLTVVRLTYNGETNPDNVQRYLDWAGRPLPLPSGDDQRTLVLARTTGSGRLRSTTVSIESAAIIDDGNAQREANQLVRRITERDDGFELTIPYADDADLPLAAPLAYPGLGQAGYEVIETQRVVIDDDGELELIPAVEVRIFGENEIDPAD